uniref:FBA_2 domain-containing protein n=1 Tax=Caenorhabditis tropicalis TaxID=1561998 RepID=A0A1I7U2K3_9PELO
MVFHLFRFPESIYIDIINTMNPCEQFFTSLCSRKAYSIIKTNRYEIELSHIFTEGNVEFGFGYYHTPFLTFIQSSEIPDRESKEFIIDRNSIRFELKEEDVVTTYWAEPIVGTMKLIEYVSDLFNVGVNFMRIHFDSGDRLMKWVQSRQKHLDKVQFDSNDRKENRFTPEQLKNFIMGCEAESIILDAYTTEPVQIQNFQKKCKCFCVFIGEWFTLENLMSLDCMEIWVTGKQFSSTEMNRFFKHWMRGGSPRLTLLRVKLDNYNEKELMDGIDVKWNMKTVNVCTSEEVSTFPFHGLFEIQKTINGMSAGFKFKNGLLYFGVWPSSFNLFRLPQLAFMNIINAMNSTEQFLTSLCSRKAFSIIKTYRRRSENITLIASDSFLDIAQGDKWIVSYQLGPFAESSNLREMVTINGESVFSYYDREIAKFYTRYEEPIFGTMEIIEHVTNLFGSKIDTVVIDNHSGTQFMNWVQKRQRSLKKVEITSYDSYQFKYEDLKNIIKECESDSILLNALHSSTFKIQNLNKKFDIFDCRLGNWITVDNLMTLDCIRITVQERQFMCAELNRFIKHWIQGGSPRLEVLRVASVDDNEQELFDGLNVFWNIKKVVVLANHQDPINGFFEVVRNDGITGGFQFFNDFFWFGVWPRDNGDLLYLNSFKLW